MAFTPDQIEEIKRLAREEIDDLRDARDSDIRVTNRLPSPSDLGPSGALQWIGKIKDAVVFCWKRAGKIICYLVFVVSLYDGAKFVTDCIVPATLPEKEQIARRVHDILTTTHELPRANADRPRFVAFNPDWDEAKIQSLRWAASEPQPSPEPLLDHTTIVSSTGIAPGEISGGFNYPLPSGDIRTT
jgi:hypothetical protein